jgi:hypothetical protein
MIIAYRDKKGVGVFVRFSCAASVTAACRGAQGLEMQCLMLATH